MITKASAGDWHRAPAERDNQRWACSASLSLWEHRACCCGVTGTGCCVPFAAIPEAMAGLQRAEELAEHCTVLHCSSPLTQSSIPAFFSQTAPFPEPLLQRALLVAALPGAPQGLLCPQRGHSVVSLCCCWVLQWGSNI